VVEDGRLLGDPEGIVPGQDHGRGAEADVRTLGGQKGHELEVVGTERIVVEVVLHGPEHVEAEIGGQPGEPQLLVPGLLVGDVAPPVGGEDHLETHVHRILPQGRHDFTTAVGPQAARFNR
jgi:hypothetical protein